MCNIRHGQERTGGARMEIDSWKNPGKVNRTAGTAARCVSAWSEIPCPDGAAWLTALI